MTVETYSNLLPKHILYGVAFLPFSLALRYSPHRFLVNKITVFIGKLSFSIYLVHFMVLKIMKNVFSSGFAFDGNSGFILAFLLVLLSSICISFVTHRAVEIPGTNLGKHFVKKL